MFGWHRCRVPLGSRAHVCLDVRIDLRLNEFARCSLLSHDSVVYTMTATVVNHVDDSGIK